MSREQGPHPSGDATVANAAGRRWYGTLVWFGLTEAAGMSISRLANKNRVALKEAAA